MNRILKAKIVEKYGTQIEFAKKISEHEAIVSRVVRGYSDLPMRKKKLWAKTLDCNDISWLFGKAGGANDTK